MSNKPNEEPREKVEIQDFKEQIIDNPSMSLSTILSKTDKESRELKELVKKGNFTKIELAPDDVTRKSIAYGDEFFEKLEEYDKALASYKSVENNKIERAEKKAKELQKECLNIFTKFLTKCKGPWKDYNDLQLRFLKMYGELSKREWLGIDE